MKYPQFKGFIFDFDGTIMNTHPALIGPYKAGFASIGLTCNEKDVAREMHFSLRQTAIHYNLDPERSELFCQTVRREVDNPLHYVKAAPFDETIETLKGLKAKGMRLGIVSGSRDYHIKDVLKIFNLEELFDFIIGGDLTKPSKPDPYLLNKALSLWPELNKQEVVYIGDSLVDVEAAKRADIHGTLVDRVNEYPDFKGEKITSLKEVLYW